MKRKRIYGDPNEELSSSRLILPRQTLAPIEMRKHTISPSRRVKDFAKKEVNTLKDSTQNSPLVPNTPLQLPPRPLSQRLELYRKKALFKMHQGLKNISQQLGLASTRNIKLENVKISKTDQLRRNYFSYLRNKEEAKGRCLIDPNGGFKKYWETFKFTLLLYVLVYLPLEVAFFHDDDPASVAYILDKFTDLIFTIDIVFTFFTPVQYGYLLTNSHRIIAKVYLQGWFIADLLAVFPFEELVRYVFLPEVKSGLMDFLHLLKVFRLLRLFKLVRLFKSFDFKTTDNLIIKFVEEKLRGTLLHLVLPNFVLILGCMHVYSCVYYYLGTEVQTSDGKSWIVLANIEDKSIFDQYVATFYFIVQTFTTVGYGDIRSVRMVEYGFRMFSILSGVILYSLFTGQIVNYRSVKTEKKEIYLHKVARLSALEAKYCIPSSVCHRIIQSYEEPPPPQSPEKDFRNLTQEEIDELEIRMFSKKYGHINLFKDPAEWMDMILLLGRKLKHETYYKDQPIYFAGEPAVKFYIIYSGSVVFESLFCSEIPFLRVRSGFFGEFELLTSMNRQFTVKADEPSHLYYLDSRDFKQIFMQENSVLATRFKRMAMDRFDETVYAYRNMEHFLIRKLFWRKELKGRTARNKKKQYLQDLVPQNLKKQKSLFQKLKSMVSFTRY